MIASANTTPRLAMPADRLASPASSAWPNSVTSRLTAAGSSARPSPIIWRGKSEADLALPWATIPETRRRSLHGSPALGARTSILAGHPRGYVRPPLRSAASMRPYASSGLQTVPSSPNHRVTAQSQARFQRNGSRSSRRAAGASSNPTRPRRSVLAPGNLVGWSGAWMDCKNSSPNWTEC
jgi:hypothetical protein